jgi:hypothetical protein
MSTVEIMKAEFLLSFIPHIETQLPYGYHNVKSSHTMCFQDRYYMVWELTVDMISGYPIYSIYTYQIHHTGEVHPLDTPWKGVMGDGGPHIMDEPLPYCHHIY